MWCQGSSTELWSLAVEASTRQAQFHRVYAGSRRRLIMDSFQEAFTERPRLTLTRSNKTVPNGTTPVSKKTLTVPAHTHTHTHTHTQLNRRQKKTLRVLHGAQERHLISNKKRRYYPNPPTVTLLSHFHLSVYDTISLKQTLILKFIFPHPWCSTVPTRYTWLYKTWCVCFCLRKHHSWLWF
jgi:hypothetical protein